MRAISITLKPRTTAALPLAYNSLVQGLLYSCWHDTFPELHNEGFGESHQFRLFTFSPLRGKCNINKDTRTIIFTATVNFEVRSPVEELLDELVRQLSLRDSVRLGSLEMDLVNAQSCDRLLFPQRAILHMKSPVVAYKTLDDGHTLFFSPSDREWLDLIKSNAKSKAGLFSLSYSQDLTVIPRLETLRKHVTRFKGTIITGWTGDFIVAADPQVLSMLYFTGLGAKNSQGFGMFDILDERP